MVKGGGLLSIVLSWPVGPCFRQKNRRFPASVRWQGETVKRDVPKPGFSGLQRTRLWIDSDNAAKGPQTEGDADRAKDTFAKLGNTPKANAFILDLAQATAERDARRAAWYRDALPLGQKAGDLQMLDRKWQEREPSIFQMPSMQKWGK